MANRTRNGTTGRSGAQSTQSTQSSQSKGTAATDAPPKISATKDGGVAGANRRERKEEARRQREALLRKRARRRAVRIGTIAGVTIVVLALVVGLAIFKNSKPKAVVPQSQFPGLITTTDTRQWTSNTEDLAARLKDMNMPPLGPENVTSHIHQELQIFINGQQVQVPAFIGIDQTTQEFSEIHVHATDGVIHVETPEPRNFTLANVFGVWGLNFTPTSIGGYTNGDGKELRVYLNGKQYTGDPTKLPLRQHEIIVVTYGTQAQVPSPIPTTFDWASSTAGG